MIAVKEYGDEILQYVRNNKDVFEKIKGSSVLITGAAGLIGSYLTDLIECDNGELHTNCTVYAIDKDEELLKKRLSVFADLGVKCICLDVNEDQIDDYKVDYLIHAASNTSPRDYASKPISTMRTNIIGTDKMLSYCVKNDARRFVFCSSVEVYGMNNGDIDEFDESYSGYVDCNTLRAGYPSAKRASEALCNAYSTEHECLEFVIARIGRIYGPTVIESDAKSVTQFIQNAVNGESIVMKSNGLQEFSYCYVGDCAMALLYVMLYGANKEAYNIADPKSKVLLRDFAEYAAKAGQTDVTFTEPTNAEKQGYSKITKATMATKKLEQMGWRAEINIQEGIDRTVRYLKRMKGCQ